MFPGNRHHKHTSPGHQNQNLVELKQIHERMHNSLEEGRLVVDLENIISQSRGDCDEEFLTNFSEVGLQCVASHVDISLQNLSAVMRNAIKKHRRSL